jgi:hypothetical protein
LAGLGVITLWPGPKEPEYNGKKLSEWLEAAGKDYWTKASTPAPRVKDFDENASPEVKEAVSTVRSIGTNSLPWLVKWVGDDRANFENRVFNICVKLPRFLDADSIAGRIMLNSARRKRAAVVGFLILGEKAAPAVPQLVAIVEKPKSQNSRMGAIACLGVMGKSGQSALPCLEQLAQSRKDYIEQVWANWAIWNIEGVDPGMIGPVWVKEAAH